MTRASRGGLLLAVLVVSGLVGALIRVVSEGGGPQATVTDPIGPVVAPLAAPERPTVEPLPPASDPAAEVPPIRGPARSPPTGSTANGSWPTTRPTGPHVALGPPRGEPSRLLIPAIGVDIGLVRLGLAGDGTMEMPAFGAAGWYAEGPPPGHPGPAVLVAHVDSWQGPDVFFRLRELSGGEEVRVVYGSGDVVRFVVERREQTPKDQLPGDRIWPATAEVRLTLITCGGRFDRTIRSYDDNVIAYTVPAPT
jgi:hypothetical protein